MLPAIFLVKIGFMSIVSFMVSQITSPYPSLVNTWSLPERIGGLFPTGLISSSPSVAWTVQLTDFLSVLTISPVAFLTSQPSVIRLPVLSLNSSSDTCEWSTDLETFSWFRLSVNNTRLSKSQWIRHTECALSSGATRPLVPYSLMDATTKAIFPACLKDAAVHHSSPATLLIDQPPTSNLKERSTVPISSSAVTPFPFHTADTCPIEESLRPTPGDSVISTTTPHPAHRRDRRQVVSSPSSPNVYTNPLFHVTAACPVHAQYTLPFLDVFALPTLTEVNDVSHGTSSSLHVISDTSDVSTASSWSLSSLTSRRLLERLTAKVFDATVEWAVAIFWLALICYMVLALLFGLMFLLGSHAIFTSLKRADLDSSPQEKTFIYAVQTRCSMSYFAVISVPVTPAFISTCDVDVPKDDAPSLALIRVTRKRELVHLWPSQTLLKEVSSYPRLILTELVLTVELCERFEKLLQYLIDWEIMSESPMALEEPSFDSISPPSLPPTTPPPSTPPRQTRRTRARQMSLSMSPFVVSRSMPSPDPFAPPEYDDRDSLGSPLEGEIYFPDDLDGSFGLDNRERPVSLTTPERAAPLNSVAYERGPDDTLLSPAAPVAALTDPFSSPDDIPTASAPADDDSNAHDEVDQSIQSESDSGTLSFSLVEDDDQESIVEDSADTSDQSIVESTNFREYFDSCGVEFDYIDFYLRVRINDEGDSLPRRSTAVVLEAQEVEVDREDWIGRMAKVPGLRVILAIPASFKATTRHLNVSMMLLSCEASFSRLDPTALDIDIASGAATHVSYWKRIVKIDISGDPPEQIPVDFADYDFAEDEGRFEILSDEQQPSTTCQAPNALSRELPHVPWFGSGKTLSEKASPVRLISWHSGDAGDIGGSGDGFSEVFEDLGHDQQSPSAPSPPRLASSLSMDMSFAEDGFSDSISHCTDDTTNRREETPSMISDSSAERLSVSPDFPHVPMEFEDLGIFEDASHDDGALFTPSKMSYNSSHSQDSEIIRRYFGSRRREMEDDEDVGVSSSFGSPRSSEVRRRKPLGVRNME